MNFTIPVEVIVNLINTVAISMHFYLLTELQYYYWCVSELNNIIAFYLHICTIYYLYNTYLNNNNNNNIIIIINNNNNIIIIIIK